MMDCSVANSRYRVSCFVNSFPLREGNIGEVTLSSGGRFGSDRLLEKTTYCPPLIDHAPLIPLLLHLLNECAQVRNVAVDIDAGVLGLSLDGIEPAINVG